MLARLDCEGDSEGESLQSDIEEFVRAEWKTLLDAHHVDAPRLTDEDSTELIFELIPTVRCMPRPAFVLGGVATRRAIPMASGEIRRLLRAA